MTRRPGLASSTRAVYGSEPATLALIPLSCTSSSSSVSWWACAVGTNSNPAARSTRLNSPSRPARVMGAINTLSTTSCPFLSEVLGHAQAEQPVVQFGPFAAVEGLGLGDADAPKGDEVSRPQLAQLVQVGGDDLGNLGIAANGLAVHPQDDTLAVMRDLHRPRTG